MDYHRSSAPYSNLSRSGSGGGDSNRSGASLAGGKDDLYDDYPYSSSRRVVTSAGGEGNYVSSSQHHTTSSYDRRDPVPYRSGSDRYSRPRSRSPVRGRSRSPSGHYDFRDKRHVTPPRGATIPSSSSRPYDRDRDYGRGSMDYGRGRSDVPAYSSSSRFSTRAGSRSRSPASRRYDLRAEEPSRRPYPPPAARYPSSSRQEFGANLVRPSASEFEKAPTVRKDFYSEHPSVRAKSEAEIEAFRHAHKMTIFGTGAPRPVESFEEAGFPDFIMKILQNQGFSKPTPIQSQVH